MDVAQQEECRFDVGVFEGPLDLLLYLIHRDELDIYDIPIEKITRQYMAYLEGMKRLDIDVAGEFLVMAASLMLIKSRTLLPVERRNDGEDEEDEEDPRLDLVRQLVEYKKFKDAAGTLMAREASQAECYLAGGEVVIADGQADDAALRLADVSVVDLVKAFQEILRNRPVAPIDHLKPIVWSVPEKIDTIVKRAAAGGTFKFTELFTAEAPRGEIIVTFLALLELIRQHKVSARQDGEFAEILIERGDALDGGPAEAAAEAATPPTAETQQETA